MVRELYSYDENNKFNTLFKPTRASEKQFRLNEDDALSYFATGGISEDGGFAFQPWKHVEYHNAGYMLSGNIGMSMGNYFFTDANTGDKAKVEYTKVYSKGDDGKVRICVHHSSMPFTPQ